MADQLLSVFKAASEKIHQEVVGYRRHLHQYPELSFEEKATSAFVAALLKEWGIPFRSGIGGYGILASIEGQSPHSKRVALRADMDALPILEKNEAPYVSKNPGVMHACGHDVHTASLLGTAKILQANRDSWQGTVQLIFQPGEEKNPGGASLMLADGVFAEAAPSGILGQHVHPPLEAGKIGFFSGPYMAASDEIYLTVKGRGGHAARPHLTIDPVAIAAQILVTLQNVVSRNADPSEPSVLSFGYIASDGGATNVIPNEVKIAGTLRTMNEAWREEARKRIRKIAESVAFGMGGVCHVHIDEGYPVLVNDPELTAKTRRQAEAFMGKENVVDLDITLASEDFAFFAQALPGCFYRLGTGNPSRGITSPVHTNTFDVDETCLAHSSGLMAWLAVQS